MTNDLLRRWSRIFFGSEPEDDNKDLKQHGTPHAGSQPHSGRYPWGSGENPYQHSSAFMREVVRYRKEGLSDTEIAKMMNMSTGEFRSKITTSNEQIKNEQRREAKKLRARKWSYDAIAEELGVSEGTVRNYLKETEPKKVSTQQITLFLKEQVDSKGMIDVGAGVEKELNISDVQLNAAIEALRNEGYITKSIRVEQMTNPGNHTIVRVLCDQDISEKVNPETGTDKGYIYRHSEDIQTVMSYDQYQANQIEKHPDFERGKYGLYKPQSIDSSRIQIRYNEEGGVLQDGVIQLRRGVDDLSLGRANYAQVRIAVDGTHYLKGMAMYSDDMPDGVDIIFNTNKSTGTSLKKVLKPLKTDKNGNIDWDNPFGAAIKSEEKGGQRFYIGSDGKEHLSAINIVNMEGDWQDWSKTLSSQFLSKQNVPLVEKQLKLSYQDKLDEYNDILTITNPTIKQKMLLAFADDCDASAVHLKAISLPRQASHVILPVPDLKENEIYAPNYKNGETVVLIRYPHAGTFEIPELKVNNKHATAKSLLGQATDAVGINQKTAEQLSGADFDGDTVMVIPVSKGSLGTKIKATPYLEGLKHFSTSDYEIKDESDPLYLVDADHGFHKQTEMGKVSNLITDMTLLGAKEEEIERAVKHSMVVIDAEKHHLDWRQSYIDNRIGELKQNYQGGVNAGASTLISRASSDARVPKQKTVYTDPNNPNVKNGIDIVTGKKVTKDSGETYHKPIYEYQNKVNPETGEIMRNANGQPIKEKVLETVISEKTGKEIQRPKIIGYEEKETVRQEKTTKMAIHDDAFELVSPANTLVEQAYARYANDVRGLGSTARKIAVTLTPTPYSPEAKAQYATEVASLNAKLNLALSNAPRERQAQLAAGGIFKIKKEENPSMTAAEEKKIKSQALVEQRVRFGAKKSRIEITDGEWEAIQAGAISTNKLKQILDNTDQDALRERAMPRENGTILTDVKKTRIDNLLRNGYTQAEIAARLGISASLVSKYINGKV